MSKKRILITGATGKVGKETVKELKKHDYEIFLVDREFPEPPEDVSFMTADLTDFGQTLDALSSVGKDVYGHAETRAFDAIIHLASIPHPREYSDAEVFRDNMLSTYNVFESSKRLGITNIVWSSSETLLGIPFDQSNIKSVPLTEDMPSVGTSTYAITKVLGEELARQFCANNKQMKIACLRLSNVMEEKDYNDFPSYTKNPETRMWNFWSYIDVRDAAQAIRKAVEYDFKGMDTFIITNDDTVTDIPSVELMKRYYPNIEIKESLTEYQTLLSNKKAKDAFGYQPKFGWRKN